MKHLLSIEALSAAEIRELVALGIRMKAERGRHAEHPLRHRCWGLFFSKSSTRTRVSFEVGVRELGGDAMFFSANDLQLGRGEPVCDTARVVGRMLHGAIIRTFAQSDVEEFAQASGIPTINALTDEEHPCQILADLQTIQELLGTWEGKTVCFVGDGACNVPRSWMWAAKHLQFRLRLAAPEPFQPPRALVERMDGCVEICADPEEAARGAEVLYTDVWVSMGKEEEAAYRLAQLGRYQINARLVALARPGALVMHCLPAYREKEITAEIFEQHAATIFQQAENRLHAQKAVLSWLVRGENEATPA